MEVLSAFVYIVVPSEFFGLWQFLLSHFIIEWPNKTIFLFLWEQGWNHTDSKDIVDQLEESFFSDMGVCE
jgi:hypothetical protein